MNISELNGAMFGASPTRGTGKYMPPSTLRCEYCGGEFQSTSKNASCCGAKLCKEKQEAKWRDRQKKRAAAQAPLRRGLDSADYKPMRGSGQVILRKGEEVKPSKTTLPARDRKNLLTLISYQESGRAQKETPPAYLTRAQLQAWREGRDWMAIAGCDRCGKEMDNSHQHCPECRAYFRTMAWRAKKEAAKAGN